MTELKCTTLSIASRCFMGVSVKGRNRNDRIRNGNDRNAGNYASFLVSVVSVPDSVVSVSVLHSDP